MLTVLFYTQLIFLFHIDFGAAEINKNIISSDTGLNISQLCAKYGYPFESHEVQTEDGYILGTHRVPYGKNNSDSNETKPAVLLMHGLTGVSTYWTHTTPSKALAFLLADNGYDVWLANQRGNFYSLKHTTLDPEINEAQFFNYSMHEVGVYDIPANIDYILNITGQDSLFFGGHSQGTNDFFVFASEKPEYNDKIKLAFNFGATIYLKDLISPIPRLLAKFYTLIDSFTNIFEIYRLLPKSQFTTDLGILFCNNATPLTEAFCTFIFQILCGFDIPQFNNTMLTVITTSQPAGSSIKTLKHFLQHINSGVFRQYDYGSNGNILEYGQEAPPVYNLSLVTAPVAIYYGKNDWFATVPNVERLAEELPNVVLLKLNDYAKFNHIDFIWAIDVVTLLYNDVLALLNSYK